MLTDKMQREIDVFANVPVSQFHHGSMSKESCLVIGILLDCRCRYLNMLFYDRGCAGPA